MKENHAVLEQDTIQVQETEAAENELAQKPRRSYLRKYPRAKWILLAALVVFSASALAAWNYFGVRETTDDAQIDGHITMVSARVGGTALNVNFDDHQFVQKGQTLVQIDPRDYGVALNRARAELADATNGATAARTNVPLTSTTTGSALSTAQALLSASEQQAAAADARVREAEANHKRLVLDLERMKELIVRDEVSRQQYDNAIAAEDAARAALEGAGSAARAAHSQVAQAQAQVRAAQTAPEQIAISKARAGSADAAVAQRQAAVDRATLDIEYATVKSPINAVAGERNVQPGQVVAPGQPLLALVDLDNLWCTANFKETQLRNMKIGQAVKIQVDAYNAEYNGHVEAFGGATGARFSVLPPENATGNYVKVVQRIPVKIIFDSGQDMQRLRPGMSVVVTVITK
jgi:membrane fusion protein (multidrug efflux system)